MDIYQHDISVFINFSSVSELRKHLTGYILFFFKLVIINYVDFFLIPSY